MENVNIIICDQILSHEEEGQLTFHCSCDNIDMWDVEDIWLINLISIASCRQMRGFQTWEANRSTVAWGLTKPTIGGNKGRYNGTRNGVVELFAWKKNHIRYVMGNLRRWRSFSKNMQVQEKIIRNTSFFVQVINACVGLKAHEVGSLFINK